MMRTRTLLAIGVALIGAAAAFAVFASGASAATRNVTVADNAFTDIVSGTSTTTIVVGDTVLWTWSGGNPHSVTADDNSFDSNPPLGSQTSGTFSRTFSASGTYEYYCREHSVPTGNSMNGTIIVQVAPTATNTVAAATNTPAAATSTPVPGTATSTRTLGPATTGTPTAALPTAVASPTPPGGGAAPSIQAPVAGAGMEAGDGSGLRWISLALAAAGAIAIGAAAVSRRRA
jgi:plastocyanin